VPYVPPSSGSSTSGSSSSGSSGSSSTPITDASGGGAKVPEPLSVLVWSALAGAGMLRYRARQRLSQRVAH
jgi:hypothetical protein